MATQVQTAAHPLDPLSREEIERAVAAVRASDAGRLRFVSVALREPAKDAVLSWARGTTLAREAEVVVLAPDEETAYHGIVELDGDTVTTWRRLDGIQPAMVPEEYGENEQLIRPHPD